MTSRQPVPDHNQLLRHGMLSWVTRGVYLGHQRNYLELQVDDVFLGDDSWDPVTNVDELRRGATHPHERRRRRPGRRSGRRPDGLQLDMVYNGAGNDARSRRSTRCWRLKAQRRTSSAGSTTRSTHPNLDCSTRGFIAEPDHARTRRSRRPERPAHRPAELVDRRALGPGQHPPRATRARSTRRSSPTSPTAAAGGTLPAGSYDYGITARSSKARRPRRSRRSPRRPPARST